MDFLTNRLSDQERKRVEEHLRQCTRCTEEYHELLGTGAALQQKHSAEPTSAYYATILPRVRERLASHPRRIWERGTGFAKIALPLAVSAFLVVLLMRIPADFSSESVQTEALHQEVADYNDDEVFQAAEKVNTGIFLSPATEIAAANVVEHLPDSFLKSAVSKQIENNEIAEIDMEGMISDFTTEQVEQVLSGLSERKSL
jgi:hypothetical protein